MPKKDLKSVNIPAVLAGLYEAGEPGALGAFLEQLLEKEREWTDEGYSDGFYVFGQIRRLAERSMREANTDMTSFLLTFQNRHFDADFPDAAEENESDIAFGLKEMPPIRYSVGSEIEFGCFPFSDLAGAPEAPILWESLIQKKDRALLLAKYGIRAASYHDSLTDITWDACALRKWLNTDFLQQAFSPEERSRILKVRNRNSDNELYHIKGGSDTTDHIFLLSSTEAEKYCADPYFRRKKASPYAKKSGAETAGDGGCKWLLRSPGNMWMSAACINADGEPDDRGVFVQDAHCCICPALWIRMQSNEE